MLVVVADVGDDHVLVGGEAEFNGLKRVGNVAERRLQFVAAGVLDASRRHEQAKKPGAIHGLVPA